MNGLQWKEPKPDKATQVTEGIVLASCLIAGPIGWFIIAADLLARANEK